MQTPSEKPIYSTRKSYVLNVEDGILGVNLVFTRGQEILKFLYRGKLREDVTVKDGKIIDVQTNPQVGDRHAGSLIDVVDREVQQVLNPKPQIPGTYHNILRFKEQLKDLVNCEPGWKKDIDAVVNGSGEFGNL